MSVLFRLYTVELKTENSDLLAKLPNMFLEDAEVSYFNRSKGVVKVQFISTASEEQIVKICDEFKKEVELDLGAGERLVYKVIVTR